MKFTHLHTHSHYSLLDGLAKIDDLVARTKELGMNSLAITDHGNLYGAIEFYKKAKAGGIKPIIGIEAYMMPEQSSAGQTEKYYHLILLCQNNAGWKNLLKLVTHANLEGFYYKPRINKDYLRQHSEGLIALSGCISGEIGRLILANKLQEAERVALDYQNIFGSGKFFLEIGHHPGIRETINDQCNLEIELHKIHLPKFDAPDNASSIAYLKMLIDERVGKRYATIAPVISDRIKYELGVIEKMGFADYFLIVQDLINWAKDRGIVVGPGRGSAAGSIVSYILGITDIDPIKFDLLFERFLNPDRIQMPDIDIDITDKRREEVMGYLRERYGENRVAHIITFGTMAARAAIRDVGRALGISYGFCDQLAKMVPFNQGLEEALKNTDLAVLYQTNADAKRILDAARHMEGVARHASVHACGIVISESPLTEYLPLQKAPQDENTIVSQFEMHSVEDLGLLKMDLLGLKNLTTIEETVRLINDTNDNKIDINNLPAKDEKTFKLLQLGDTTGVFQLESSGMRRYLKELKPTELEDIIAMISLYRPGPMELIPEYVARKFGRKKVEYLHPKLEPIFKNTYGIMIYQEQLMSAARMLANFTLSEADVLRKAVGKKIRKLLLEQKEKLIRGCIANNVPKEIAEQFWALVEPFDRYGFNRSHAACYATIAYQTAYLKAHYPVEFMFQKELP